jgi:tetratricopeptide (TPR) repeat protein
MANQFLSNASGPHRLTAFWLISLFLVICTAAVYAPVRHHDFINHDDEIYVKDNKHVQAGLRSDSIQWAFSITKDDERAYWHPFAWLSHMLDCQMFGVNAGYHHLANLLYHLVNVLLLFLVFTRMTSEIWKSAFMAALFAVHPLNVDSVAWIAERKNLLSTAFWFLTMLAYTRYARSPSLRRYVLVLAGMTAGLLAKPMLVTLPCVLLLMDFWPLKRITFAWQEKSDSIRFPQSSLFLLISEKIPLLALSGISTALSTLSLQHCDQFISHDVVPMGLRVENAVVSYIKYILKIFWPRDMTIFYPFPAAIPLWQVLGALILLIAALLIIFRLAGKAPFLAVGWLWFYGTLVPVIGIVQGGRWPAIADRWTYVPAIGLFIVFSWGGAAVMEKITEKKAPKIIAASLILLSLMIVSSIQVKYWKNSITLFSHAIEVTKDNGLAHYNLGQAMGEAGDFDQAISHYYDALKINPRNNEAHVNLANALARKGKIDEAISHFNIALSIKPEDEYTHFNLAKALFQKGTPDEAAEHFKMALKLNPQMDSAYVGLGNVFAGKNQLNKAIEYTLKALEINPKNEVASENMGKLMRRQGNIAAAFLYFQKTAEINPDNEEAKSNLKQLAVIQKKIDDQAAEISEAIKTPPHDPSLYIKLGRLYQSSGYYDRAIGQYEKALEIQPDLTQALYSLGITFTLTGRYDQAIPTFKKIVANEPDNASAYYNIACVYSRQNKKNDAVEWLQKAVDRGYDNWNNLTSDPDLDNIKDEPGFRKLMEEHGLGKRNQSE